MAAYERMFFNFAPKSCRKLEGDNVHELCGASPGDGFPPMGKKYEVDSLEECQMMCEMDMDCHAAWYRERNGLCRMFGDCDPDNRVEHERGGDLYICQYDYGHQCHCNHGMPAMGSDCDKMNGHICSACSDGYHLNPETRMCEAKRCNYVYMEATNKICDGQGDNWGRKGMTTEGETMASCRKACT
eukprot:UN29738